MIGQDNADVEKLKIKTHSDRWICDWVMTVNLLLEIIVREGRWKPVSFSSRPLTSSAQNTAQSLAGLI